MINNDGFIDTNLPEPLTKPEQNNLFNLMYKGDKEARDKLIIHNIRLIVFEIRKKFSEVEMEESELISVGLIGLINAVDSFDISRGVNFSTYAMVCIDNEIFKCLNKMNNKYHIESLDRMVFSGLDGEFEAPLVDVIPDDFDLEEYCINKESYKIIRDLVEKLPPRDCEIIKLYFGFYDGQRYNQAYIGEKFSITQTSVSKRIILCLKKLKFELEQSKIIEISDKKKILK